jgi:tRNA threonylcarbamoyl adenosine modification protein YeaZ
VTGHTLALSTASPALSLALFAGDACIAHDHRAIGRGHAEALMPAVAALLAGRAPPAAVLVDIGPGSFTGIRIGIAAARALGLAWGVPVTGFSGAALVAARAFAERPGLASVRVLLDGGRGQLLVSDWAADFGHGDTQTLAPDAVAADMAVAGAGAALLPERAGRTIIHAGEPDTAFAMALPAAARGLAPAAHYVRPPDAILPLG